MKRIELSNLVIFLLFFGVALIESIKMGEWLLAAFWMAIAVVFLFSDLFRKRRSSNE